MMSSRTVQVAVSAAQYWFDRPYSYRITEQEAKVIRPGMRVEVPFGGTRPREAVVLSLSDSERTDLKGIYQILDEEPILNDGQLKLALWMRDRYFCTVYDALHAMLPTGLLYKIAPIYRLSENVSLDLAYESVGKSSREKKILDCVVLHKGDCPLEDIEAVSGTANPAPSLASMVKKGILVPAAEASRKVNDRHVKLVSLAVSVPEAQKLLSKSGRAVRQSAILRVLCEIGTVGIADLCYFTGAGRDAVRRLEQKGLIRIEEKDVYRRPEYQKGSSSEFPILNQEQERAFQGLSRQLHSGVAGCALLHGVTGSGKTTVYLHLIREVLSAGKSAILLVPEISLTPQMLHTFSSYFGDTVAVLHSSLSVGERYDEWKRIHRGHARLVIGTRSAIFAPVINPGLIILDEEQETTYKSENSPRYHAREIAKYICAHNRALLLLGSATPDVDSYYHAACGDYSLYKLNGRYNQQTLPQVKIADMKRMLKDGGQGSLSPLLLKELAYNLENGEQSILFLNRRGTNKLVQCPDCGFTYQCPNCSTSLTYHSLGNRLICHYCGYETSPAVLCPDCGSSLSYIGAGTQKIVEELGQNFPGVEVLRMDTDAVAKAESHAILLERFRSQNIPIMVGTQMVTKGLNFENVTLVGVLSADQSLYSGSYRAAEQSFSMITQVIGRSGRFSKPGRAVIQTYTPENRVIQLAAEQDYLGFYREEIELRRSAGSPPLADMFRVNVCGEEESLVIRCCQDVLCLLRQECSALNATSVLGPAPHPVVKVNRVWRYRLTVLTEDATRFRKLLSAVLIAVKKNKQYGKVTVYADCNPTD